MRMTRRRWMLGVGAVALVGASYVDFRFRRALANAQGRVAGRSSTMATAFGTLEYAVAGSGPALLMVHGTGGGFDQGLSFAAALRQRGHRIISPSRFGYLRSDFPTDPSPANQADLTRRWRALDAKEPLWSSTFDVYMSGLQHVIKVAGPDHVCFGADWDGGGGIAGMQDVTALPAITARLRTAGYGDIDLAKMLGGNVLRIVRTAEARRTRQAS